MRARRLVTVIVALAVAAGLLGGATAGADPASSGGPTANSVKRSRAAHCAKLRRAAQRASHRRGAARKRLRGCGSGRPAKRVKATRPAAGRGPSTAAAGGSGAAAPTAATTPAAPGAGPAASPSPSASGPAAPPAPVAGTLGVSAWDVGGFVLRLTKTTVPAGTLTIFFRNHDVSDHNLWIEGPRGDVLERVSDTVGENGGDARTLAVTAGAWRLFCALPDHGSMTRTLTVTP